MSRYRLRLEYTTHSGERRRVTFIGDMNGLRWFRREEVSGDGQWICRSHEQVTPPVVHLQSIGAGSFGGP